MMRRGEEGGGQRGKKGRRGGSSGRMTSPSLKCHHYLKPRLSMSTEVTSSSLCPSPLCSRMWRGRMFVCVRVHAGVVWACAGQRFQGKHEWMFVCALCFMPLNWQAVQPIQWHLNVSFSADTNSQCFILTQIGSILKERVDLHVDLHILHKIRST